MTHGQCRRPVRVSRQSINLLQQFTDDDGRRLYGVVAGACSGITDVERRSGTAQYFEKRQSILVAAEAIPDPGCKTHLIETPVALPTREMIAVHPQQADQPRRDAPAVGQRCKRNAATHETPTGCVADTLLYGITQYRQRQWANKPRNQAVPREPG